MGSCRSYLPTEHRAVSDLNVNAIWTNAEGYEDFVEAQFYDEAERNLKYIECTCFGIKPCMNEMKTVKYSDIASVTFEDKWTKKSSTNGADNTPDNPEIFNVCNIRLTNGKYIRLAPVTEEQMEQIKIVIHKSSVDKPDRQRLSNTQSVELGIVN